MITLERSQKLLSILRKREQTPEMLARIARVESEIASLRIPNPAPIPAPEPIKKKKKKTITKEIEVDEDEDEE